MGYKWKPSASQRREFAAKMADPIEKEAYEQRKIDRENNRRSKSRFNYHSAGGCYIPTESQYNFCMANMHLFDTSEKSSAANEVIFGYTCNEKVNHDSIHVVNEVIRNQSNI